MGNYGNPVSAGPLILWTINFVDPVIPRSQARILLVSLLVCGKVSSGRRDERESARELAVGKNVEKENIT